MNVSAPHYLLFSESKKPRAPEDGRLVAGQGSGRWRFVLETVDGRTRFEAADEESESEEGRLALLAVVRGLEALEQPSRVTVVTPSRYVSRGFQFGLEEWRENGWRWERFGEMTPIKNRDLWQRIDRAMKFHQVECRVWRFDMPETSNAGASPSPVVARGRRTRVDMPGTSDDAWSSSPPTVRRGVPSPKQRNKPRSRQHSTTPGREAAVSWGQRVRDLWQRCRTRLRGGFHLEAA